MVFEVEGARDIIDTDLFNPVPDWIRERTKHHKFEPRKHPTDSWKIGCEITTIELNTLEELEEYIKFNTDDDEPAVAVVSFDGHIHGWFMHDDLRPKAFISFTELDDAYRS